MKYCTHCGTQLMDEAIVCPNCGCIAVDAETDAKSAAAPGQPTPNPAYQAPNPAYTQSPNPAYQPNPAYTQAPNPAYAPAPARPESVLRIIAKILVLISCIFSAFFFLFPLCWTIPMTVHYWKHRDVGTGFKVCTLIFLNTVAGILMLCDNQN